VRPDSAAKHLRGRARLHRIEAGVWQ